MKCKVKLLLTWLYGILATCTSIFQLDRGFQFYRHYVLVVHFLVLD